MTAEKDATPPPAEEGGPTLAFAPTGAHDPTRRLGPAGGGAADDEPAPPDAEYSATVLGSHWIQRPEPDDTLVEPPAAEVPETVPDHVEGTLLRFGPGVTAAVAHRTLRTLPALPAPAVPLRRRMRRHALPALVVLAVLVLLAWQHSGRALAVDEVAVTARPTALGCDDTADVVGLVTTNGRAGTLTYRWIRSDGTTSGVLREVLVKGQKQARLHLRWTYRGKGHSTARAQLSILTPGHRTAATHFTYDCP
ncbi:hypothetical protein ACIRPX_21005 [Streptomyces sp. NPDC101225]|uniref:hypothetical protein n=1 Tax=Streptomyces sp. NPDC101225 TaxID=3366135 RepID=UPI0038297D2F